MVVRSEYYRHLYLQVAWDQYSLENIANFFHRMSPILISIYPFVDQLNKKQGRPATDRRFQLRFLIWWKLFGPQGQQTAVNQLNRSPSLQQILKAPVRPYTRYSLRRFLNDIGESGFQRIGVSLLDYLHTTGLLQLETLVLDSFPVYSYLNTGKCLRMAKFDSRIATQIYQRLDVSKIVQLFPTQHKLAVPLSDKLKVWIHHFLWDIPTEAKNQRLIFGSQDRQAVMGLLKGWKSVVTYRNFLAVVKSLSNHAQIESQVVIEVTRVLRDLGLISTTCKFRQIENLRAVFHKPHRFNDPGISMGYCSAKDQHFMGRGGLIAITADLEIPLLVGLTPKYKQSESQILTFLKTLNAVLNTKLKGVKVLADSEFGTQKIQQYLASHLQATNQIEKYGNSSQRIVASPKDVQTRKAVERVIGRLTTNFQLEHPMVRGPSLVAVHLQLAVLSDLLLVCYNQILGKTKHIHSYSTLGGKKF